MQIEVEVKGQRIKRINSPGSVEDTLNYLTCHFTFDGAEWENTIKTVYFKNHATKKIYSSLIADDGTCTVPWEALTDKGFVRFSVAGERDGYRITTGIESFYNSETVYGGNPSEPPTPDQYDQLIALAEQTMEIAESVREDADAGEFDGPPGPQGPKGEDGDPGPQGPAGKDGQDATDEQVRTAVDAYMKEHPIQGDTDDIIKLAIKNEASGAVPISITDSADMGVQELAMRGWTEQDSTTGAQLLNSTENTVTSSGITCISKGSTITINGERVGGDGGRTTYITSIFTLQPGIYSFSYETFNDVNSAVANVVFTKKDGNEILGTTFTLAEESNVYIGINMLEGKTADNAIIRCMLNEGSTALPYEPYTGGKPSPSPEYPQPITSAGKYSEEMGKWEYEITIANEQTDPDKNQTVTLTADRPLTKWDKLEKRNGQWGWVYKSAEIVLDGSERWYTNNTLGGYIVYCTNTGLENGEFYISNFQESRQPNAMMDNSVFFYAEYFGFNVMAIRYDSAIDLNQFKNFLGQNSITLVAQTAEETFVPLSETEQEALNTLHTYYPTTMLSNDAGCEMTIKYIADTKAYIDSKIAAIQAAVVNRIQGKEMRTCMKSSKA